MEGDENPEAVEGLKPFLGRLQLGDRMRSANEWCEQQGAGFLEEVASNIKDLAEHLQLSPKLAAAVAKGASDALQATLPAAVAGVSREATEATTEAGESRESSASGGEGRFTSAPQLRPAPLPEGGLSFRSISEFTPEPCLPRIAEDCGSQMVVRRTGIKKVLTVQGNLTTFQNSPRVEGAEVRGGASSVDEDSPAGLCAERRTTSCCTLQLQGPLSGLMATIPVKDRTLSISEVNRTAAHMSGSGVKRADSMALRGSVHSSDSEDDLPLQKTQTKRDPKGLQRMDTVGNVSEMGTCRGRLKQKIGADDGVRTVSLDEGQTGKVFALEIGGARIAVFKPLEGEGFSRRGIPAGQGVVREEAVYLVDRFAGSRAGVPVTSRASIHVTDQEHLMEGSLQVFVANVIDYIENLSVPRDLAKSREFVSSEDAEALALLDIRVLNTDRHGANLLVLRNDKPHGLGPIDHGCCLPPWWALGEANFEAWLEWPHLKQQPCEATKETMKTAISKMGPLLEKLKEVGLDDASVLTLRICTLLAEVGILERNLPLRTIAGAVIREDYSELSWLEERVLECAMSSGASCRKEPNNRGDNEIVVDENGAGLQVDDFLQALRARFLTDAFPLGDD